MQDSLFTKIIKGEIPSHKIYEDEKTFVFLDIYPVHVGHVLVIPKKQVEFVWDLDDETYQAVMATAKKVASRLKEVVGARYVGSKVVGVDVPHAHVHIIPFNSVDELAHKPDRTAEPNHTVLAELAQKLAF
ncbi:MAG: HIT family protein [Patescibacteria group bacterium]